MAEERTLMVVGGGQMGEALVAGLIRTGWAPPEAVVVVEKLAPRRAELAELHHGITVASSVAESREKVQVDAAVLATKPADIRAACDELADAGIGRVLSLAAGITIRSLEEWLRAGRGRGDGPAVIRAMPNTPALVGSGAAAISPGTTAGEQDVAWAREILEGVGTVVELPEVDLDAVTGLSGSGPGYVFLVVEALVDAGVLVGLTRAVARELAVQTLLGSARLLAETGDEPSVLRASVTSPGGTTAAGLRVLEAAGVRSAVLDAVVAATERSRQLGEHR
jgi:pyrroline-5-carboxylate reductase